MFFDIVVIMKTRIKEEILRNGLIRFVPQKRFLFFFWESFKYDDTYFSHAHKFDSLEGAIGFIKRTIESEKRVNETLDSISVKKTIIHTDY